MQETNVRFYFLLSYNRTLRSIFDALSKYMNSNMVNKLIILLLFQRTFTYSLILMASGFSQMQKAQ